MKMSRTRLFLLSFVVVLDLFLQVVFKNKEWGVFNSGVSFGLFHGVGQGSGLILYSLIILYLIYLYFNQREWSLSLIVAGGMGNLFLRFVWGGVWDYIHLVPFGIWINMSDVLITSGVVWYLWNILSRDGNTNNI